jgi:peptidyl-prolyl cis-trans isomerase SurA
MHRKRVNQVQFCLLSLATFLFSSVSLWAENPTRIAAVVNHRIISETDLKHRVNLAIISSGAQDTPAAHKELARQVLNLMIEEQLQLQLGEEFKFGIDDDMLNSAIIEIEKQNGMEAGRLRGLLAQKNIPEPIIRNQIKANIIWREYIRGRYRDSVREQISEKEVTKMLDQIEAAKNTRRYALSEILIASTSSQSNAVTQALAQKIVQQLRNGAQFTALAQQFSNAASASRGGDIGWVSHKNLDNNLVKSLNQISPGQFTEPIATERGYYIFYLRDRLEPGEIGKSEIFLSFKQIMLPHPEDAFEFEVRENLNRAHVLAKSISSCRVAERLVDNAHGRIQTANKIPASNLSPELRNLLMKLKPDQSSSPINTEDGVLIFVLCSKEIVNPQAPTREEIRENLIDQKLQLIAEREMRNRRRNAHIDIRFNK